MALVIPSIFILNFHLDFVVVSFSLCFLWSLSGHRLYFSISYLSLLAISLLEGSGFIYWGLAHPGLLPVLSTCTLGCGLSLE